MLGVRHAAKINELWDRADLKAALPAPPDEFFALSGTMPENKSSHRAYKRYYLRRKALVSCRDETLAVYLLDCSRMGMGLISPVQLFPCQQIKVYLGNRMHYRLEIRRCRRVAENCYECGTIFILHT